MKRAILGVIAALSLAGLTGCVTTATYYDDPAEGGGGGTVQVGTFYDALSPYGEWVVVPRFGRVWRPAVAVVGPDFVPYQSGGHWVYTDVGWSWVSDWDWGWAPFHYGRWMADPAMGWLWVPDTVWAPAWVDWRYGGGYVGWTPMAPPGITVVYGGYRPAWCFVETRYLVYGDVWRYRLPPTRYHEAYSLTQVQRDPYVHGSARWYAGPPVGHVSSAVGRPIEPVRISAPPPGRVQQVALPRSNFGGAPPGGISRGAEAGMARSPAGGVQVGRPPPGRVESMDGRPPSAAPEYRGVPGSNSPAPQYRSQGGAPGQGAPRGFGGAPHGMGGGGAAMGAPRSAPAPHPAPGSRGRMGSRYSHGR